jgi:hypothetical protein
MIYSIKDTSNIFFKNKSEKQILIHNREIMLKLH